MIANMYVYLFFDGRCKEAFEFYAKVFNTSIDSMTTYEEQNVMHFVKETDKIKVLHCCLPITKTTMLSGCDFIKGIGITRFVQGTNISVVLAPETEEATKRLYEELSEGGKISQGLNKTFWNSLYAKFTDKFGIEWMLNYSYA